MPRPEDVNPSNFIVKSVVYNNGDFAVALGCYMGGADLQLGMRWNDNYPTSRSHPVWFIIPEVLTLPFLGALLPTPYILHSDLSGLFTNLSHHCGILALLRSRLASSGAVKADVLSSAPVISEIWCSPKMHAKALVVSINVIGSPTQGDFEDALKELLKNLDQFQNIENIIFTGGGDYILPDWFVAECRKRGINIHIVSHEDSIDEVINRLGLNESDQLQTTYE